MKSPVEIQEKIDNITRDFNERHHKGIITDTEKLILQSRLNALNWVLGSSDLVVNYTFGKTNL